MRPIDADRLKTYYDRTCTSGGKFGEAQLKIIEWAKDIVDSCNTIDAIQVIRCKECKHYTVDSFNDNTFRCCEIFDRYIKDNNFCSFAERKENGSDL